MAGRHRDRMKVKYNSSNSDTPGKHYFADDEMNRPSSGKSDVSASSVRRLKYLGNLDQIAVPDLGGSTKAVGFHRTNAQAQQVCALLV